MNDLKHPPFDQSTAGTLLWLTGQPRAIRMARKNEFWTALSCAPYLSVLPHIPTEKLNRETVVLIFWNSDDATKAEAAIGSLQHTGEEEPGSWLALNLRPEDKFAIQTLEAGPLSHAHPDMMYAVTKLLCKQARAGGTSRAKVAVARAGSAQGEMDMLAAGIRLENLHHELDHLNACILEAEESPLGHRSTKVAALKAWFLASRAEDMLNDSDENRS